MPAPSSGLEREVQDIVKREVAGILAPLADALAAITNGVRTRVGVASPRQSASSVGRSEAPRTSVPAKARGKREWTGESIRALRESLGLTQKDFASRAGVSGVAVYQWESGRSKPRAASARKLVRLAKVEGAPPAAPAMESTDGRRKGRRTGGTRKGAASRKRGARRKKGSTRKATPKA